MVSIVLIDSQRLFRVSLKRLIDSFYKCQVVLDVSVVKDIPRDFDPKTVHLVIVDPKKETKKTLDEIRNFFPYARIVILTNIADRDKVVDYMGFGVSGLFSKEDCPKQLEKAIHDISTNYTITEVRLGAVVREFISNNVSRRKNKDVQFSDREIQILKLVCNEKTNSEISDILGLSRRTVEAHRRRMIDKSDCRNIIGVILNVLELKSVNLKAPFKSTNQAS